MSGFADIHAEMKTLSERIETLSGQLEEARTVYEQKKHAFELAYAGAILAAKLRHSDWTQTDLNAHATEMSSREKLDMILAQSTYRKLRAELKAKDGRLEVEKEKSWNLRQEMRRL